MNYTPFDMIYGTAIYGGGLICGLRALTICYLLRLTALVLAHLVPLSFFGAFLSFLT